MESDAVQVFEYKYEVRNPKSPIPNLRTTWYVDFPGEDSQKPLTEFATSAYRQKWDLMVKSADLFMASNRPPNSLKSLMNEVKKIGLESEDTAENLSVE